MDYMPKIKDRYINLWNEYQAIQWHSQKLLNFGQLMKLVALHRATMDNNLIAGISS